MAKKTLEDLIKAQEYDDEIAAAVTEDIKSQGTADKILAGELSLPSPIDAQKWHDVRTGKAAFGSRERQLEDRLAALESELRGPVAVKEY